MRTMAPPRGRFDAVVAPDAPRIDALAHIEWLRPQVVLPAERRGASAWAWVVVVLALAAVALTGVATAEEPIGDDVLATAAFELQQAGRLDEAADVYRAAIERDPTNPVLQFNLGVLHHGRGEAAAAAGAYEAALASNPTFGPALFNLAVLKAALGDPIGAADLYRRLLAVEPDDAGANLNLGVLLLERGEAVEGTELINRAVALDPSLLLP